MDPEPFEFQDDEPKVVHVHRYADMWVAAGARGDWPFDSEEDDGWPVWIPVDVLPGAWGARVEEPEGWAPEE